MAMRKLGLTLYGLFLTLVILTACGSLDTGSQGKQINWPDFVRNAPQAVQEAYQYAVDHPDELAKYPCYCGCGKMGHTSNASCFVRNIAADGTVTFDNHAAGCGICVDIARDVMRLKQEGQSSLKVRQYIDTQYGSFGPSTNTALPTD